jgi:hypothetical protein
MKDLDVIYKGQVLTLTRKHILERKNEN